MESKRFHGRNALLIFLISFLTFSPTLRVGFMLDDQFLVPRLRSEWTLANLRHDFTSTVHDEPGTYLYRPLQKIMIRAQHHVGCGNAVGYHAVSLVFHAANSVLVYALALCLGAGVLGAAFAGVGYGVHPIIVDDLFAGTGGESMAIFFILAAILSLRRAPEGKSYGIGIVLYGLALFAKESGVVVPCLLGLVFWKERRPLKDYRWIMPLFLLWVPYGLLRAVAVPDIPELSGAPIATFLWRGFPLVAWVALRRIAIPIDMESWPPLPPPSPFWLVYGLLLLGLGVASIRLKSRWIGFALGWLLLNLAPRVPAMLMSRSLFDQWISCASIGVLTAAGALGDAWGERRFHAFRVAGLFLAVGTLMGWTGLSSWTIAKRGSDEKNYRWTLRHEFRDFAAHRLSVLLLRSGRAAEALTWLDPLVTRNPENLDYANTLALAEWQSGQPTQAIARLEWILRRRPDYAPAQENLTGMRVRALRH